MQALTLTSFVNKDNNDFFSVISLVYNRKFDIILIWSNSFQSISVAHSQSIRAQSWHFSSVCLVHRPEMPHDFCLWLQQQLDVLLSLPSRIINMSTSCACPVLFPDSLLDTFQPGTASWLWMSIWFLDRILEWLPFPSHVDYVWFDPSSILCPAKLTFLSV